MTDRIVANWSDVFRADVVRFFNIRPDAEVLWVDPQVQVYDPDEPCDTCKMSWFAVEVGFRMPDGRVVEETRRGDMTEFLTAVSEYAAETDPKDPVG